MQTPLSQQPEQVLLPQAAQLLVALSQSLPLLWQSAQVAPPDRRAPWPLKAWLALPILVVKTCALVVLQQIEQVAPTDSTVLLLGETGTGKELIASRLHYLSDRWEQRIVKVNCAALTESILESELFGHEAGAFTGAQRTHIGHFERADGGTLVLDELATITLRMQEKILRVIEYGEIQRVGGSDTLRVDVRIVGSTNADLQSLAAEGRFRQDLLDRLAFDVITVPPLRERLEDAVDGLQQQGVIKVIGQVAARLGQRGLRGGTCRREANVGDTGIGRKVQFFGF